MPRNISQKLRLESSRSIMMRPKRLKVTETLPGCRLQQDAQHLAQIENQVSQQQSAAVSSGQRLDPNPNDDLAATGKQIKALLWKNSLEELGGLVANGVAICCHMLTNITKTTEPVWYRNWYIFIEGSLGVKLPTIWRRWKSSQQGEESEEKRSEERRRRCRCAKR